jgi:hypothetical protein
MTPSRKAAEEEMSQLLMWKQLAEEEISELEGQMAPLEHALDGARERLDLIRRLIHLHGPQPDGKNGPTASLEPAVARRASPATDDLEDAVREILESAGEPMHIGAIREALIERDAPLPGRGDEANIIVRLRRDPNLFTRTGRGMYALATWGLPEMQPTARKRKIKRTRRSSR